MKPTKQQIKDYLNETPSHTRYTATIQFEITIEEVYKILEER